MVEDHQKLKLLRELAVLCREEGVRRGRIGDVEVEMAVVTNPLQKAQPAANEKTERKTGGDQEPRRSDDWMDAIGVARPVIRRKGE
jgi:hypothetical protein